MILSLLRTPTEGLLDRLHHRCPQGDSPPTITCPPAAQQRQKEFTSYRDYIGMDITSLVSLPVWIMEPFTILQRMAEIMEYTEHLDTAAGTEDQYDRCETLSMSWMTRSIWVKQGWRD